MGNLDISKQEGWARMQAEAAARRQDDGPVLKSGDGGGTYDGMEARVITLEKDMSEIKSDLKAIRSDLSYLRGKVDSMPTTLQLLGFAIAVFVAAGLLKYLAP